MWARYKLAVRMSIPTDILQLVHQSSGFDERRKLEEAFGWEFKSYGLTKHNLEELLAQCPKTKTYDFFGIQTRVTLKIGAHKSYRITNKRGKIDTYLLGPAFLS